MEAQNRTHRGEEALLALIFLLFLTCAAIISM